MKGFPGEFEELVLLTIVNLDMDSYGVAIKEDIAERAKQDVSICALHSTLTRLEEKGYIKSWMGNSTRERGGRRKRFFEVTYRGKVELLNMKPLRKRSKTTPSLAE
jgi:PadR family transcriptional regulator PadR